MTRQDREKVKTSQEHIQRLGGGPLLWYHPEYKESHDRRGNGSGQSKSPNEEEDNESNNQGKLGGKRRRKYKVILKEGEKTGYPKDDDREEEHNKG